MFCSSCGTEIPDGAKFCPSCGKPAAPACCGAGDSFKRAADNISAAAGNVFDGAKESVNNAGKAVDSAVSEMEDSFKKTPHGSGQPLKTDRSLIAYILLSIITCGIYGYYFIYTVARDVNTACSDDDEETAGLGMFILLSIITCGFYGLYWEYKLGNRLQKNAPTFGISIQENGTTILLWRLFGALICVIGTYYGSYILIRNVNTICDAYNKANHLG